MATRLFLGIDPGVHGAVACFHSRRGLKPPEIIDTPNLKVNKKTISDISGMADLIAKYNPDLYSNLEVFVIIEHVHAMPGQGVVSTGNLLKNFGIWLGLLAGITSEKFRYVEISPVKWKKHYDLLKLPKEAAIERAMEYWPGIDLLRPTPKGKKKKPAHDRADAALMAGFVRENYRSLFKL